MADTKKTPTAEARERKKIKQDLILQLKARGLKGPVTLDLVEQYMEARDRYIVALRRRAELLGSGLDFTDDVVEQVSADLDNAQAAMASILSLLNACPRSERRAELEAEIRDQLATKGLKGPVFEDKIDTFLKLWDAFQEAVRCLNARGRTYFTVSSAGKNYEKDNSATKDIVTMAKAMEDLLDGLEITVKGYADPEDDEL